jgi:hypothetical protein
MSQVAEAIEVTDDDHVSGQLRDLSDAYVADRNKRYQING